MRSLKDGMLYSNLSTTRRNKKTQESLGEGKRERKQIKQGPVLVLDEEDDDLEDGDFHHVLCGNQPVCRYPCWLVIATIEQAFC